MLNKLLIILLIIPMLYSCNDQVVTDAEGVITAKGGVRYGGNFRFMSSEKVKGLFPLETTDMYTNRILPQIFEGLLKIDPGNTELIPSIAKETSMNENSTIFTRSEERRVGKECRSRW